MNAMKSEGTMLNPGMLVERAEIDVGDLRADLDTRIGDLVEQTARRYLPHNVAKDTRHSVVRDMADKIIQWERDSANG